MLLGGSAAGASSQRARVLFFFMFPLAFSMPAKIILVPRTLALGSYRTERDDVSSAGILRHNQDHLNSRIMIEERTHGVQLQRTNVLGRLSRTYGTDCIE